MSCSRSVLPTVISQASGKVLLCLMVLIECCVAARRAGGVQLAQCAAYRDRSSVSNDTVECVYIVQFSTERAALSCRPSQGSLWLSSGARRSHWHRDHSSRRDLPSATSHWERPVATSSWRYRESNLPPLPTFTFSVGDLGLTTTIIFINTFMENCIWVSTNKFKQMQS